MFFNLLIYFHLDIIILNYSKHLFLQQLEIIYHNPFSSPFHLITFLNHFAKLINLYFFYITLFI